MHECEIYMLYIIEIYVFMCLFVILVNVYTFFEVLHNFCLILIVFIHKCMETFIHVCI